MHAEGLFEGRRSLPGEAFFYAFYDRTGENLPFMALVRAAPRFVKGWQAETVRRAGKLAATELAGLVQPYAPGVLKEHREAGRRLVLTTTTPVDLISSFAEMVGFDEVIATRYDVRDGRYTGSIDGDFVWAAGKLRAIRRWAEKRGVALSKSYAYSDSIYDTPLLRAVGHPHAVNPDRRLRVLATALRWPIEEWDRPPGVPKFAGMELYHVLRHLAQPRLAPYVRFDIDGLANIPQKGPAILASNHRSYFDVLALAMVVARLGRPARFLAKRELFEAPLIGQLATALGGISVDRGSGSDEPLRAALRALEAGELVVVLPQGTIPRGRDFFDPVLKGKTGAARLAAMTGAPVVPIGLWGTEKVWPRSSRLPNVTTIASPPKIRVRVGSPVRLGLSDAVADTAAIMESVSDLLPGEAHVVHEPTEEELAKTLPPDSRDK